MKIVRKFLLTISDLDGTQGKVSLQDVIGSEKIRIVQSRTQQLLTDRNYRTMLIIKFNRLNSIRIVYPDKAFSHVIISEND